MQKFKSLFRRKSPKSQHSSLDSKPDPPVRSSSYCNAFSGRFSYQEEHPPTGTRSRASSLIEGRDGPHSQRQSTLKSAARTSGSPPTGRSSRPFSSRDRNGPDETVSTEEHAPCLPPVSPFSGLSSDLEHMTLSGDTGFMTKPSAHRYSESVADRNIGRYGNEEPPGDTLVATGEKNYTAGAGEEQWANKHASYAEFNEHESQTLPAPYRGAFQPPQYKQQEAEWDFTRPTGLSRPPKGENPSEPRAHSSNYSSDHIPQLNATAIRTLHPDLEKIDPELADLQPRLDGTTRDRSYISKDQAEPPSLSGIVDLNNTTDIDVQKRWAPAVTHESVHPQVHHMREEHINREIHNHDVYHRILPVIDVEVLPARHFVPASNGGVVEVMEDQLPDCTGPNQNWVIAEKPSKSQSNTQHPIEPRKFTARTFEGDERDEKRHITSEGFERIENTWVHRPTLEDTSRLNRQTYAVRFGSGGRSCGMPDGASHQIRNAPVDRGSVHPEESPENL